MPNGSYLTDAGVYLVNVIFGLFLLAIMLRFLLQTIRADFYNPICQFLITLTNPALWPLRRLIPSYMGIDWSSIVLMIVLQFLEICLIALLANGPIPSPVSIVVIIIAKLLELLIWIYIFVIIIQAIISWFQPVSSPATVLLYRLSEPLIRPIRRYKPMIAGIDLSPLMVLILLQLALILLIAPLQDLGVSLSNIQ